ncbi:MAG: PASTA domain-containing protein [Bacteroidetes bacterium]|nr:PASTA domain-containing protein [Bacteroidota bacterium]
MRRRLFLRRVTVVRITLLLFFLGIVVRLVQVQVIDASKYQELARRQHEARVVLPAARGKIYDRNMKLLVSNTLFLSYGADPVDVGPAAEEIARRFAFVFNKSSSWYMSRLTDTDRRFVWLERRVPPALSRRIKASTFDGIIEMTEPRRLYHYGRLGGQVIGFTDVDHSGLDGIELQLNDRLKGTDGHVIMQRDAHGQRRPSMDYPQAEPINGADVVLTIDIGYQSIVEEELQRGVEHAQAESGLAVIVDPASGEVLAMANYPPLDPATVSKSGREPAKNRVITDMFEPGSVFKVVTAAAALEYDLVRPEHTFDAEEGKYVIRLPREKPRTISDTHPHGILSFREAMEQSSNIVMAKVSDRVGAERLYTMARNFGFGTETGIELPGEVGGKLKKPTDWSGTTLNSMAYGYEVGVTPLQIVTAYATVANGGVLMKPYIVRQIIDETGEIILKSRPQAVRRVMSPETAEVLSGFFEGVVERGTGSSAQIQELRVAGKTGTARKFVSGRYERGSYTASFVGFFPAEDPKVVCLVMLDRPRAGAFTGGVASAPIFKRIARKVYSISQRFARYLPSEIAEGNGRAVPDVVALRTDIADELLRSQGFDVDVQGDGPMVWSQDPESGAVLNDGAEVVLHTREEASRSRPGYTTVPDLRGLPMRRAINSLAARELVAGVKGSGVVVSQSPAPGREVKTGSRVAIRCEPKNLSLAHL